ncbi:LPS heptosyltransferase [Propionigenium maris DSM 9537]|uniref:LPS heptosyltransferase n=1 Tax=Propionigenium maris DSM 9537 TaxID=1123000 RepID=A0A9W6LNK3_9FUSO|nr:glycosyltransferase family 9 protein [Propionigenium maris]GLI57451.1 LPS heptosyltransferase [Propionigenium maris DSM 9537]
MEIKRIIVARTDKIGDLVLSIPSFFMLRKMYPEAEIVVLVRKYNYEIVKNLPYVDRVLKIDDYRQRELLEKIKHFKADVFIALYNDTFVAKLAKASRAKWRVGPLSKINSFFTYNKGVWQKRSKSVKNEADYNLDLIRKLDPKTFEERYEINTEIFLGEEHKKAVGIFLEENSIEGQILVVNPFMGGSAKNITDDQYVELLKRVKEEKPQLNIVIACHISEEERGQRVVDGIEDEKTYLFANGGDLLNLAALIERADVYFGGSTGPTHIAGSLKRKIVALYPNKKTQHPTRWGVYGWDGVDYVIPDEGNSSEDYSHKDFDSYSEEHRKKLIDLIVGKLGG